VPTDDLTGLFAAALAACGGSSTVVSAEGLADAVAAIAGSRGTVLVAPELGSLVEELRVRGLSAERGASGGSDPAADLPLTPALAADFADTASRATCGVTGALLGIAASGTVAVDTRSGNAGLLSCLPPHHIVLLPERSIVPTLADALEILARESSAGGTCFVLISGPSRTSDIEMMSVLGVHGPLRLDVLVVREDA
jgi:L-lactate utilization protein LutC